MREDMRVSAREVRTCVCVCVHARVDREYGREEAGSREGGSESVSRFAHRRKSAPPSGLCAERA